MARIIDVIDHVNVAEEELAYREPQQGSGDWRMGSQVIVSESQAAVFVRAGQALDVLGPGRHTLSVANIPILSGLIGMATSGRTPFTADLYFINLRNLPQVGWGTSKPIYMRTNTGLGIILLRTHGVIDIKVADPMMFLKKYGMNRAVTRLSDIKTRIQTMLLGEINNLLLKSGAQNIVEANGVLEDLEGALLVQINDRFNELGLTIQAFESNPFDTVNVPIEELRDVVPLEVWLEVLERQKRLDIGMAAAQNEGLGGAMTSAGLGLGVGQQLGSVMGGQPQQQNNEQLSMMQQQMMQQQQMMNQMMQQMMNNNNPNAAPQPAAPPAAPSSAPAVSAPQSKEEIQALIDSLDMKLAMGEISETIYNKMVAKWQERLDSM
ncbi:MAG: SPFH domain-containing protein [Aggregatilineales bacterium]